MVRVTSKDVAREAGVSQATVSFVLNGRHQQRISSDTQQLVLRTAQRLGYVPSASGRALSAGRSRIIVCVVPDSPVVNVVERFKRELTAVFAAAGYACVFVHMTPLVPSVTHIWQHIDPAAVVAIDRLSDADSAALSLADIPLIDGLLDADRVPLEGLDQSLVSKIQIEHLASRGHRHIAYLAMPQLQDEPVYRLRLAGVRTACAGLNLPEPIQVTAAGTKAHMSAVLRDLLVKQPHITAVAAYSDDIALALLEACHEQSVRVPEALAIVGVDDIPAAALSAPALTTVAFDLVTPARDLVDRALALLGEPPLGSQDEPRGTQLAQRETT